VGCLQYRSRARAHGALAARRQTNVDQRRSVDRVPPRAPGPACPPGPNSGWGAASGAARRAGRSRKRASRIAASDAHAPPSALISNAVALAAPAAVVLGSPPASLINHGRSTIHASAATQTVRASRQLPATPSDASPGSSGDGGAYGPSPTSTNSLPAM